MRGSRAEMAYSKSPSTTASSRSKPISTSRSRSMPVPVHAIVASRDTRTAANSGVNRRVSTGAMFSMTLCLASTSQAPTTTAPMAPHGRSHCWANHSTSAPMAAKAPSVKPVSTPPPRAMST